MCPEYISWNLRRKPNIHVYAGDVATSFYRAGLSVLGNHGNVLGGKCNFWQAGGG